MIDKFQDQYKFLSNFYNVFIEYEGVIYPSTEHAYQAAKTTDTANRKKIASLPTPGVAKKAGKKLILRDNWDNWEEIKLGIMFNLLLLKFQQSDLAQQLLATGQEELVEGNDWHDNFWGVCNCDFCIKSPGKNWLGKLLMLVRSILKKNLTA